MAGKHTLKRITIVGKFPPIQGGVSAQVLCASIELARMGYDIDVVTNANSVEENFRVDAPDLQEWSENQLKGYSGSLAVHYLQSRPASQFIPSAPEFAIRLAGLATRVIEEKGSDLVIGWYFVPYAFAAESVAKQFGLPLALAHAGSDLFRLSGDPEFMLSIKNLLRTASKIMTFRSPTTVQALKAFGVPEDKLVLLGGGRLPVYAFPKRNARVGREDWSLSPRILHYSKVSESKGTFDLVQALALMADEGFDFEFVYVRLGWRSALDALERLIQSNENLASRTTVVTGVAPWRVKDLLSSCQIVVALERDFSIAAHSPRLVREVLAAGRCLVVSSEVAEKQKFSRSLIDGKTVIIIDDPKNVKELRRRLAEVVDDSDRRRSIAVHGNFVSQAFEDSLSGINAYARSIAQIASTERVNWSEERL